MKFNRSSAIAQSFGASAGAYERHADLQRKVAERLALLLPALAAPNVLELGCGTGLLSRHLLARYPDGSFVLTDIAEAMLAECRTNLGPHARVSFALMDGSRPPRQGPFDLIATSMTLHWLTDPVASLQRYRELLAPGGVLLFAALGPESFAEWRRALEAEALPSGIILLPSLPGIVDEQRLSVDPDTLAFLRRLKAIGGTTPREGYRQLSPGHLRRAIRKLDAKRAGITWHIVYGRLGASGAEAV
jgi:malonyl-CoA O-methyltransferase